jgi:Asp-tRNA(Asn)/Glu-tRNA(Gln) amidotransferase C subunit
MSPIDVEALRQAARMAGFEFSETDLAPIQTAVERALQALERLEALPVANVEPVTQFRVV